MSAFVPALAAWLRSHHGVVSRSRLLELGLTPAAIKWLVATGELIVVHEGVYRHAIWPDTFLSRCAAHSAADRRLVVCCGGATRLWEYRKCTNLGLHLLTDAPGRLVDDGTVIHRCTVLPPEHIVERPDGIRVTSAARTVFDISKHVTPLQLESVIEQGLRRSQFDIPTLYDVGQLLCRRGRGGSRRFADVLTSRPAWRRPVDSHPELDLLRALERRGVQLRTQVSVRLPNGITIHPDLGDPAIGFFIEIDDLEWHQGRLPSANDDWRDRQLRLIGARVERVGTDEVAAMPPALVRDLLEAYRQQKALALRVR